MTSIGIGAFGSCSSLTTIIIPEGVTNIEGSTFVGCSSLTSISIPESVTSIGDQAFSGCSSLTSITIPERVTNIGNDAFSCCYKLEVINIPEGVTNLGSGTFFDCRNLTSISIPERMTSIGELAFFQCNSLTSITCKAVTPPTIGPTVFMGTKNTTPVYVPKASVEAYQAAEYWSEFFINIQAISEDTAIEYDPTNNAQQPTIIYDLQGRRVENPGKGVYIVNGKKVVIK